VYAIVTRPNSHSVSDRAAEKRLLLACTRTRVTEKTVQEIRSLVEGDLDWPAVIDAAANHGVLPLVGHHLLTLCSGKVPNEWRMRLQNELEVVKRRNLYLAAEMLRLSGLFRAKELMVIPYKGPLLASQAYGDFALRQFADLDFAVLQNELPRAAELLSSEGYEAVFGKIGSDEGVRPTRSEYQFRRAEGQAIVELQTETTLRYFPHPLDLNEMSKRLTNVKLGGMELLVFSPEDTFIMLAVHGAKHFWERLMWIADIGELSQTTTGIAWPALFLRASEMGVGRMVRLALCLTNQMLETPLPEEVLEQVQGDAVAVRLASETCRRFTLENTPIPVFQRFRFRVATREKLSDGVRYALRLATSPTDHDRTDLPLPVGISGAHRWLRPFLLMKRYGIRGPKPR
jgi:hypothetical protein